MTQHAYTYTPPDNPPQQYVGKGYRRSDNYACYKAKHIISQEQAAKGKVRPKNVMDTIAPNGIKVFRAGMQYHAEHGCWPRPCVVTELVGLNDTQVCYYFRQFRIKGLLTKQGLTYTVTALGLEAGQ